MKKDMAHIDKLFRDSLEDIKINPSRTVWKGIRDSYFRRPPGKFNLADLRNIFLALIITGTCVSLVSILLWVVATGKNTPSYEPVMITSPSGDFTLQPVASHTLKTVEPVMPEAELIKKDGQSTPVPSTLSANEENKSEGNRVNIRENLTPQAVTDKHQPDPAFETSVQNHQETTGLSSSLHIINAQENNHDPVNNKPGILFPSESVSLSFLASLPSPGQTGDELLMITKNAAYPAILRGKDKKKRLTSFELALQYANEWTDYRQEKGNLKKGWSISLYGLWHFRELFIRGGLGVCYSNDNGNYDISYERYDSIGYYYKVNHFTVSSFFPDSVVFNTVIQTVYDSVQYSDRLEPPNRYTYLQLPLAFGFDFYTHRRVSLSLMAGPVLSILVHENETSVSLNDPRARLLDVTNRTPDRIKANVQLAGALGIRYQLSNKIALGLEPTCHYFIRPAYHALNASLKKPYSFGIKGGIFIKF
jgi:hypothetical protein